jgi:integrase
MVWVGALLGLRWGEVAALRVGKLDLLGGTLAVTETVTRDEHGRSNIGPPKSAAGSRIMSLPLMLVDILAEHLARLGLTAADAEALVFPAPNGMVWSYSNYRRRIWQPAVSEAGLAGVGFHDLRRTATTQLVLAHVDLKTAGTRLGHSDPRLTLSVYAQATSDADRAAAESVAGRFSAAMGFEDLGRISTVSPEQSSAGA